MDCEDRKSLDVRLLGEAGVETGSGRGAGSKPECDMPNSQIGSGHLSGVASLSSRYRIALSRCPLPCFAAVRREDPFRAEV